MGCAAILLHSEEWGEKTINRRRDGALESWPCRQYLTAPEDAATIFILFVRRKLGFSGLAGGQAT
jgi:hypothetical protein